MKEEYEWNISTYKIYKPRVETSGIFDEKDLNNYHFIYVCKKGVIYFSHFIFPSNIYFYRLLTLIQQ